MKKLLMAYILGIVSFLFAFTGVFSFLFSIPGLFLAVTSLKFPEKKIRIPLGYEVISGRKKLLAKPYITSKYLAYIAIGLCLFSMVVSTFTTFSIIALFGAGLR